MIGLTNETHQAIQFLQKLFLGVNIVKKPCRLVKPEGCFDYHKLYATDLILLLNDFCHEHNRNVPGPRLVIKLNLHVFAFKQLFCDLSHSFPALSRDIAMLQAALYTIESAFCWSQCEFQ